MEVCLIYNSTLFSGVQHNNSVFLQIALHYKLPKGNDYSSLCYTICPCCLSLSYFLKYIHTHPFLLSTSVNCPFPGSIVTPLTTPSGVTLSLSLFCHCSVGQLCPILCDSMDWSIPGFPVLHHLPEFAQTYVHWIGEAIQTSHPLSSPSPPAFNLSQHQALF